MIKELKGIKLTDDEHSDLMWLLADYVNNQCNMRLDLDEVVEYYSYTIEDIVEKLEELMMNETSVYDKLSNELGCIK
jgi:hypothetical protein